MSPTVRVDDEVYDQLKAHAEPFVDTPNSVLRRLLRLDTSSPGGSDPDDGSLDNGPGVGADPNVDAPAQVPVALHQRGAQPRGKRNSGRMVKSSRAPSGSLLAEEEYELPLLTALMDLGGSASSRQVIDRVGELLADRLTSLDRERLSSGGIRWQSRVQFVRLRLIQQGLMIKETGRGVWAISDDGRAHLQNSQLQRGAVS